MKRYLIFTGSYYYPRGGWKDFKESDDHVEMAKFKAKQSVEGNEYRWAHVVDSETQDVIFTTDAPGQS